VFNFLLNDRINPLVGNWVDEEKTRSQNENRPPKLQTSSILNIFNKAKKSIQDQIASVNVKQKKERPEKEQKIELMNCLEMKQLESYYQEEISKRQKEDP
jgi:hypothetical protein